MMVVQPNTFMSPPNADMNLLNLPTPPAVLLNETVDQRQGEMKLTECKDSAHSLERCQVNVDQEGSGTHHAERDENDTSS